MQSLRFVVARPAVGVAVGLVAAAAALTSNVQAQWTVTNLHPAGAAESYAYGGASGSGGQQSGSILLGDVYRASLWSGTAASWVDLTPAGSASALGFGCAAGQQVGRAVVGDYEHAGLWSGTAVSWVDLHPAASATGSAAFGTSGTQQVGRTEIDAFDHASLWNGTAASWVDLNPVGLQLSYAYGISGNRQVGSALVGLNFHASLWTGTAVSWIDLHPAGASDSFAFGASGTQQSGYATVGGAEHASLWSGTAGSWVDLNPAGAVNSFAWNIGEGFQIGHAYVAGADRASLWSGTAASWVDLHAFVPAGFSASYAEAIWSDASTMYIAGYGFNDVSGTWEALLWSRPTTGACCNRWTGNCALSPEALCTTLGLRFDGVGSVCLPATCRVSAADFNGSGVLSVQDIFDFLAAYFAGLP